MLFYWTMLIVTAIDQGSKAMIRSRMEVGETITVWDPFLHFTYYENTGAAFSSFEGYGQWFVVIAVLLAGGVIYYRRKGMLRGVLMELGTGFLVGGALGNAIDRVVFGKVTDFIEVRSGHGIMNLADMAINVGVVLMLIESFRAGRSRRPSSRPSQPPKAKAKASIRREKKAGPTCWAVLLFCRFSRNRNNSRLTAAVKLPYPSIAPSSTLKPAIYTIA